MCLFCLDVIKSMEKPPQVCFLFVESEGLSVPQGRNWHSLNFSDFSLHRHM